jgi:ABC-type molybdate transport system, periplasmic component
MKRPPPATPAALFVLLLLLRAVPARADDVVVMTSGAFTAATLELGVVFERSTHHKVITAVTSMGVGDESIPARIARGEAVDVVILPAQNIESLIRSGGIRPGSRVDLARSAIGMAVRAGARKPDIASVEAFKRTLLDASSVAYSASVSGDYLIRELFPTLGIAEQMKSKSRRIERERVAAVVARGEAEIGFQQISELLPVAGVDFVGPLPKELQRVTVIAAAVATHSKQPDAARAFVQFLASPAAASVVVKTGMELLAVK